MALVPDEHALVHLSEIQIQQTPCTFLATPWLELEPRLRVTTHCPLLDRYRTTGTESTSILELNKSPLSSPPRNRGTFRVQHCLEASGARILGAYPGAAETVARGHYIDQAGFELTEIWQRCLSNKATGVAPIVKGALGCRGPFL